MEEQYNEPQANLSCPPPHHCAATAVMGGLPLAHQRVHTNQEGDWGAEERELVQELTLLARQTPHVYLPPIIRKVTEAVARGEQAGRSDSMTTFDNRIREAHIQMTGEDAIDVCRMFKLAFEGLPHDFQLEDQLQPHQERHYEHTGNHRHHHPDPQQQQQQQRAPAAGAAGGEQGGEGGEGGPPGGEAVVEEQQQKGQE